MSITQAQFTALLGSVHGRRALSKASPMFFAQYYLKYDYAPHQAAWLEECERLIDRAKAENTKEKLLLLAPRDHGKSWLSIALTVRALCLNRNAKILWISASAGQAEKRLRMVKQFLESERIIKDWASDDLPPFKNESSKWVQTQIYIIRNDESVDPSVEATGSGGSITGGHVDMIIMDDLEDNNTTYSSGVREKTRDWLRGTVQPMLSRGGFMLVVGTRKHHDDVYGHMIKDSTFNVRNDPAILQFPDSYSFKMGVDTSGRDIITSVEVHGQSKVLWKERPIEYLLKERQTVGSLLFAREFQNQVQSDDSAAFKNEWLARAKEQGRFSALGEVPLADDLFMVQGWDLSLMTDPKKADDQDGDYSVGTTWARDKHGNRYLISQVRVRGLTPNALQNLIIGEYNRFKQWVRCVMIEKNAFGQLHLLALQERTDLPLKSHLTTAGAKSSAWTGVPSLAALFENNKVYLPYRDNQSQQVVDKLCEELYGLGKEKHDDTVMSLWIAECAIKSSSFEYGVSFGMETTLDSFGRTQTRTEAQEYAEAADRIATSKLWSSLGIDELDFED